MKQRALLALPAFALLANFSCGRSAEERQLDSMRDEMDNIREGRGRADSAVGPREMSGPSLVVPPAYTATGQVRPPPPVLQIGTAAAGAGEEEADDPQDTTPRPTIRVFGSARGSGRPGEDRIAMEAGEDGTKAWASPNGMSAVATGRGRDVASPDRDTEAKRAYDAALSLVNARQFDQALDALATFLVKWPDDPYAENAMYWRGECYFARGDYHRASEQFDGTLKRFPSGNKSADALLKLGMSDQKLGKPTKAKECFERLVRQYPESDAARRVPTVVGVSPAGSAWEKVQ